MQTGTNTMSPSTGHTSSNQNRNNSHYSTSEMTGTPFTLISGENENFIAWGKYRLTGTMENPLDCYEYLETNKWELLVNVVVAVLQAREEYMESLKLGSKLQQWKEASIGKKLQSLPIRGHHLS